MPSSPFLFAKRIAPKALPKPQEEIQRQGLRYERRVVKQLIKQGFKLDHNPWFELSNGRIISPDIVLLDLIPDHCVVIEVKLSYTPGALTKLLSDYCLAVEVVYQKPARPLVITKNVNSNGIEFQPSLRETLNSPNPVYLWLGRGPIL